MPMLLDLQQSTSSLGEAKSKEVVAPPWKFTGAGLLIQPGGAMLILLHAGAIFVEHGKVEAPSAGRGTAHRKESTMYAAAVEPSRMAIPGLDSGSLRIWS